MTKERISSVRGSFPLLAALVAAGLMLAATQASAQGVLWSASYDAGDGLTDDGGAAGAYYGYGDPFFQDDTLVDFVADGTITGEGGDPCAAAIATALQAGTAYTFLGTYHGSANAPLDITEADIIRGWLRLGSATSHAAWVVRLEDTEATGAGDYDNVDQPVAVTETWQQFEFNIVDFVPDDGSQIVDLTIFNQVVIEASGLPADGGTFDINLEIDDLEIIDTDADVSDWSLY